jgi:hypothetical protein
MGWIFLATCIDYIYVSVRNLPNAFPHYAVPLLWRLCYAPTYSAIFAVISGVAWFVIWKGKPGAKWWAIVASFMWIFVFLRQFIVPLRPVWGRHVGALILGIVGLVIFTRREPPNGTTQHE